MTTPASWRATRETHPLYERLRRLDTSGADRVELDSAIASRYREAARPGWVGTVTARTYPPVHPDPVQPPLSLTLPIAAGAAAGGHALIGADRFAPARERPSPAPDPVGKDVPRTR